MNVQNVKPLSNFFFNIFGVFMPFWWEWQLVLYILSDFPGIKNLNSLDDLNSLNNLNGLDDLNSLISSKKLLILMVSSSLTPKWPIPVTFCGMISQKSSFLLISDTFSVRGCWGQLMSFFWKLVRLAKYSNSQEYIGPLLPCSVWPERKKKPFWI